MSLKQYQDDIDEWAQTLKVPYWSPMSNLAHLMEEVGELSRIYNHKYGEKPKKTSEDTDDMAGEMADIIFSLICMANTEGINLDDALQASLQKSKIRDKDRFEKKEA